MSTRIDTVRVGIVNSHLLRDRGAVLVEPRAPGEGPRGAARAERVLDDPRGIQLLVATRGQFDHFGAARAACRRALAAKNRRRAAASVRPSAPRITRGRRQAAGARGCLSSRHGRSLCLFVADRLGEMWKPCVLRSRIAGVLPVRLLDSGSTLMCLAGVGYITEVAAGSRWRQGPRMWWLWL
jgi:glyoxylase-like metal-dependent hydrolase (beta-lactamase superfamily II)